MYYLNRIKSHLLNWWEYIKEHFVRIIFILVLLILLCIAFCFFPKQNVITDNIVTDQHIIIFGITLENWFTYISMIALLITAVWAIYQFDKSTSRKQQEKGAEIAKDFADDFIEKFAIISKVLLENKEIKKMVSKVFNSKISSFTTMEIENIVEDKACFNKYNQIIKSKRTQARYTKFLNKMYSEKEKEKFNSNFYLLVENTLNHLEAVCMNISSQAAGSDYIYNSLHQSFLKFVETLAIRISTNNNNNVDKFFTHIIQVYNMWNIQKDKDIVKFRKTEKKIQKLNDKAEKEINKLLKKENKTV